MRGISVAQPSQILKKALLSHQVKNETLFFQHYKCPDEIL